MTPDAGSDCERCERAAAMMDKKTDAVPHFPRSTDSTDEESEGKSGNVNPKVAIDNNLQLSENSVPKTELKRASSTEILLYNRNNSQSDAQNCENTPVKYYEQININKAFPTHQHINKYLATQNIIEFCKRAAKRLSHVISWVKINGHKELFLRDFAHSASCKNINCNPFCKMFKRLRKHVITAKHNCSLLRLYSLLLRFHVNSCKNNNCGLEACPILKLRRKVKQDTLEKKQISHKPNQLRSHGSRWKKTIFNSKNFN